MWLEREGGKERDAWKRRWRERKEGGQESQQRINMHKVGVAVKVKDSSSSRSDVPEYGVNCSYAAPLGQLYSLCAC